MQVPIGLQPHPKLWRCLQQSCEPKSRIRRDAALPEDNLVQPVERDAKPLRRFELTEGAWFLFPVMLGVLSWLGLYLRDARVRALIPFRTGYR
jgi:hypothetical protein